MIKASFKDRSSYFEDSDSFVDIMVDNAIVNDYECMLISFNGITVTLTKKDALTFANMIHLEGAN